MNPLLARNGNLINDLYRPIAHDLEKVEQILAKTLSSSRPGVYHILRHLEHYRGKRLRPTLLLLTAHACGDVTHEHHVLAAVVEMIHTATLVHDDVLDNATTRRHVSTINSQWGNQASVLLGDYLFTHAFHLTSTLGDATACRLIGESTNRLCKGELHQICERGNLGLTEEDYFAIIDGKTAELTSCCCKLAAIFSGMDDNVIDKLARYGRLLGLAFQIADDLLDIVGDERKAGKSLGTDLEQQKLTLPIIHLLNTAPTEVTERVRMLLESPGESSRDRLLPELIANGSLNHARERAEELAETAAEELQCLPPSECRCILEMLTSRVVKRAS